MTCLGLALVIVYHNDTNHRYINLINAEKGKTRLFRFAFARRLGRIHYSFEHTTIKLEISYLEILVRPAMFQLNYIYVSRASSTARESKLPFLIQFLTIIAKLSTIINEQHKGRWTTKKQYNKTYKLTDSQPPFQCLQQNDISLRFYNSNRHLFASKIHINFMVHYQYPINGYYQLIMKDQWKKLTLSGGFNIFFASHQGLGVK